MSRLSYDPNGNTTVVSGTNLPTKGYAGMFWHQASQDYLTVHRIYRPDVALWDSRDPKGEKGGLNLYEYCDDDPIEEVDTLEVNSTSQP